MRRAASGLVKMLCNVNDSMSGGKGPKRGQPLKQGGALRGIDIEVAMMGFNIENITAKQALQDAKNKHTRRWQTKESTYRLKEKLLPDVRDTDVEMADSSTGP